MKAKIFVKTDQTITRDEVEINKKGEKWKISSVEGIATDYLKFEGNAWFEWLVRLWLFNFVSWQPNPSEGNKAFIKQMYSWLYQ